jgi:hypothetical protein
MTLTWPHSGQWIDPPRSVSTTHLHHLQSLSCHPPLHATSSASTTRAHSSARDGSRLRFITTRYRHGTSRSGRYTVDEVALRHGAGVEEETDDPKQAYARFRPSEPTRYREGWLPDLG